MLEKTVDRKTLSTSSSTIEGEGVERHMVRKTGTDPIRQDTKEVEHQAICSISVAFQIKAVIVD